MVGVVGLGGPRQGRFLRGCGGCVGPETCKALPTLSSAAIKPQLVPVSTQADNTVAFSIVICR